MSRNEILQSMNGNSPAGPSMMEISNEELKKVIGSGDVQGETTTFPCFAVAYYGVQSSVSCAYAAGAVVGVGLSVWKC
ncbi:mersacidin family lantibiotic [Mesobacillus maritimus]|uniref:Mersacidin family lantibiotic n=1 Tax=Mesobacillus maritimus TaxID=1643336 RepID=A0ABS7K6I0_9BACI|nr:mersacidin family lantibiotic [Mesobacillus maritimus]MBY0097854.1 mersacidin family lantibiotic [Mesobacillus maritimus]